MTCTADNTAYTLRVDALALRGIDPFGRNIVYAGNVNRLSQKYNFCDVGGRELSTKEAGIGGLLRRWELTVFLGSAKIMTEGANNGCNI